MVIPDEMHGYLQLNRGLQLPIVSIALVVFLCIAVLHLVAICFSLFVRQCMSLHIDSPDDLESDACQSLPQNSGNVVNNVASPQRTTVYNLPLRCAFERSR